MESLFLITECILQGCGRGMYVYLVISRSPFEMKFKFFFSFFGVQLKGLFVFCASLEVLSYTKELTLS